MRQLLPVLSCDLLIPVGQPASKSDASDILFCRSKGAETRGRRTPDGFVVFKDSTAVLTERLAAYKWPASIALRKQLISDGTLVQVGDFYQLTKDFLFSSPSAAAAVVQGGSANGLVEWKRKDGSQLKDLDEKLV